MSVITKDLGVATAYGYAKSKGYTGTEEEFAELMASYADVAEQAEAAAQDAEDAKDAAVSAKNDAQTAQAAAESAQTAAAGSAQTASTKASEASNSAQTAAGSATAAGNSATAASGSASTAQTAAQTATTKASEASSSASAASTAKTGAETARTGAQAAQTAAETAQANAEAAASSVSASAAQIEQNTEDIAGLKNDLNQFPNGTYPNMSVGNADQLTATVGIEDNAPYLFRTSGGSNDIGDREDVRKIVGVSIPWNQLVGASSDSVTENGITVTFDSTTGETTVVVGASVTGYVQYVFNPANVVQAGHKILLLSDKPLENGMEYYSGRAQGGVRGSYSAPRNKETIVEAVSSSANNIMLYVAQTTTAGTYKYKLLYSDITLDFGTAIADYVYSLEQATSGTGVAWLKKYFPAQFDAGYQAYDAGSLQSVSGLTAHKMVGFNQFDEETYFPEKGFVKQSDGSWYLANLAEMVNVLIWENKAGYSGNMSFNYEYKNINSSGSGGLRVKTIFTDGTVYIDYPPVTTTMTKRTVTVNSNGRQVDCMVWDYGSSGQGTYLKDFCVNFSWDGEKDGQYEPYKEYTYPLDSYAVLRGIPKVDASGNLYYDGDEYLPDGTVNRRYGIVDLGSLTWSHTQAGYFYTTSINTALKKGSAAGGYNHIKCALFVAQNVASLNGLTDKSMSVDSGGNIQIHDSAYPDNNAFKTAMSGVYLIYELATPTTETALPYQETQIVDDFGTEEFILADGTFPVPVGHETYYKNNLRAKLEMSPDSPDGDGLYVVQQTSGQNEYVPLASTATIQDILTRLTALENA